MRILGISAYYHDAAAALVEDGVIVAAAQEERFTRRKHDPAFPGCAVEACLERAGILLRDVDHVVFYDKPLRKFDRLLQTYLATAPRGFKSLLASMKSWSGHKLWLARTIRGELGWDREILFTEHHEAHAASAFFPSPFEEAAVVTFDGVGEWATTTWGVGRGRRLDLHEQIEYPDSIGLLYSAFTYYGGFQVNSGEYKLMGLAPYGEPRFAEDIRRHILEILPDGSVSLNLDCFGFREGLVMTTERFHDVLGGPPRHPESPLTQRDMDMAASIQVVLEEIVLGIVRRVYERSGMKNLCLAGGVALNCVANGRILREGPFENLWIQPAAGDAGGAVGAALAIYHQYLEKPRTVMVADAMAGGYLGPEFDNETIGRFLRTAGAPHQPLSDSELLQATCDRLERGDVVGWFQGRMEFGPRALGARSILGDPRNRTMQTRMNVQIKFRESFRPFAPSVLREHVADWFEMDVDSPYMLLVAPVARDHKVEMTANEQALFGLEKLRIPRSSIPAVTHVDYSARIQTVDGAHHPRYHQLLKAFYARTGCPVLVNTSFNVRGEPIVCTPADAYRCFMATDMNGLVIGNYLLDKVDQPAHAESEYWREQPLD